MNIPYHLQSRAEKNIADAFTYYEEESFGLGEAFLETIEKILNNISNLPLMYPKVFGDVHRALLLPFPYAMYYTFDQGEVIILNVLNTRRNPTFIQENL